MYFTELSDSQAEIILYLPEAKNKIPDDTIFIAGALNRVK